MPRCRHRQTAFHRPCGRQAHAKSGGSRECGGADPHLGTRSLDEEAEASGERHTSVSGLETPSFVAHNGAVTQGFFLTDRAARFRDLGPGYFASRIDKDRNNIRPLSAVGYTVPCAPAA